MVSALRTLRTIIPLAPIFYIYIDTLPSILQHFVDIDIKLDRERAWREPSDQIFDFIIVGAGSSGCHLAARLSKHYKILLLEAGGEPSPYLYAPVYSFYLNNQKAVDWAHRTVPQSHAALGLLNRVTNWPQGKSLGGSSAINGLIYVRGNVQGFNKIANKTGDEKWSLDNILKYYKKLEDYHGWFRNENHGKYGPMSIERSHLTPFAKTMFEAGIEKGLPIIDSNDGPSKEGLAPMEFYLKKGRRSDAYRGTLKPVLHRENLVVRKFALATKIKMNRKSAYGVLYERHGREYLAKARKEVIISAGTLSSAKLLMLSGIGPKHELEKHKIPVIADLPVGEKLRDKFGAMVGPFLVKNGQSFNLQRDVNSQSIKEYLFHGTGDLASARTDAIHYTISPSARRQGRVDAPNIHTYVVSMSSYPKMEAHFQRSFNLDDETVGHLASQRNRDTFFQEVTLSRPQGYGTVKLRDANPYSSLLIDPKYLQHEDDLQDLTEGIKFAVDLVDNSTAFKKINGHLLKVPYSRCAKYPFKTERYYRCIGQHFTMTAYKYAGTVPIGKSVEETPDAVVDSQFRVFGIKRLRVIDGSNIDLSGPSENDVTCRMLGELGSDMIIDYWT